jgi:hypothetical protein
MYIIVYLSYTFILGNLLILYLITKNPTSMNDIALNNSNNRIAEHINQLNEFNKKFFL